MNSIPTPPIRLTRAEALTGLTATALILLLFIVVLFRVFDYNWASIGGWVFLIFSLPFAIFAFVGTISLVRVVRQHVQHFSGLGYLALAWPVFTMFPCVLLFVDPSVLIGCWSVGPILGLFATVFSLTSRPRQYGPVLAIPWNVAWLFIGMAYYAAILWAAND